MSSSLNCPSYRDIYEQIFAKGKEKAEKVADISV